MTSWNDLSIKEKAAMMEVAVRNGITTLPEIREAYNKFDGETESTGQMLNTFRKRTFNDAVQSSLINTASNMYQKARKYWVDEDGIKHYPLDEVVVTPQTNSDDGIRRVVPLYEMEQQREMNEAINKGMNTAGNYGAAAMAAALAPWLLPEVASGVTTMAPYIGKGLTTAFKAMSPSTYVDKLAPTAFSAISRVSPTLGARIGQYFVPGVYNTAMGMSGTTGIGAMADAALASRFAAEAGEHLLEDWNQNDILGNSANATNAALAGIPFFAIPYEKTKSVTNLFSDKNIAKATRYIFGNKKQPNIFQRMLGKPKHHSDALLLQTKGELETRNADTYLMKYELESILGDDRKLTAPGRKSLIKYTRGTPVTEGVTIEMGDRPVSVIIDDKPIFGRTSVATVSNGKTVFPLNIGDKNSKGVWQYVTSDEYIPNVFTDGHLVQYELPVKNDEYFTQQLQNYIDKVESRGYPVVGSVRGIARGYYGGAPKDTEIIVPESKISDAVSDLNFYTSRRTRGDTGITGVSKQTLKGEEPDNLDINILKDNGTIIHQMESTRNPDVMPPLYDANARTNASAQSGVVKRSADLEIPKEDGSGYYTAEEYFDKIKNDKELLDQSIIDNTFKSGQEKHGKRAYVMMNNDDPDIISKVSKAVDHMVSQIPGMKKFSELYKNQKYDDIQKNKEILKKIHFTPLDIDKFASNPEQMKNILDYWYIRKTIGSRSNNFSTSGGKYEKASLDEVMQAMRSFDNGSSAGGGGNEVLGSKFGGYTRDYTAYNYHDPMLDKKTADFDDVFNYFEREENIWDDQAAVENAIRESFKAANLSSLLPTGSIGGRYGQENSRFTDFITRLVINGKISGKTGDTLIRDISERLGVSGYRGEQYSDLGTYYGAMQRPGLSGKNSEPLSAYRNIDTDTHNQPILPAEWGTDYMFFKDLDNPNVYNSYLRSKPYYDEKYPSLTVDEAYQKYPDSTFDLTPFFQYDSDGNVDILATESLLRDEATRLAVTFANRRSQLDNRARKIIDLSNKQRMEEYKYRDRLDKIKFGSILLGLAGGATAPIAYLYNKNNQERSYQQSLVMQEHYDEYEKLVNEFIEARKKRTGKEKLSSSVIKRLNNSAASYLYNKYYNNYPESTNQQAFGGPLVHAANKFAGGGPEDDEPVLFTPYLNDTPMQAAMRQLNEDYSKPENKALAYNATHSVSPSNGGFVMNSDGSFSKVNPDPAINTMAEPAAEVASFMPVIGDAMYAGEVYNAAKQGNYGTAAAMAGMALIPNVVEKPLKALGINKELMKKIIKDYDPYRYNKSLLNTPKVNLEYDQSLYGNIDFKNLDIVDDKFTSFLKERTGKDIKRKHIKDYEPDTPYDEGFVFVDEDNRRIASIAGPKHGKNVWVESSYVDPEFRSKGLGKQMYIDFNEYVFGTNGTTLRSYPHQHMFTLVDSEGRRVSPSSNLWRGLRKDGYATLENKGPFTSDYIMAEPSKMLEIRKYFQGGPLVQLANRYGGETEPTQQMKIGRRPIITRSDGTDVPGYDYFGNQIWTMTDGNKAEDVDFEVGLPELTVTPQNNLDLAGVVNQGMNDVVFNAGRNIRSALEHPAVMYPSIALGMTLAPIPTMAALAGGIAGGALGNYADDYAKSKGIENSDYSFAGSLLGGLAGGLVSPKLPYSNLNALEIGKKAVNTASEIIDSGTLYDPYTTFKGRLGNYGDNILTNIWGTAARRFGLPDKARIPADAIRKIKGDIHADNGLVNLIGNKPYLGNPHVNVTFDRGVVSHSMGQWDGANTYITPAKNFIEQAKGSLKSIEPSDVFSNGANVVEYPSNTTLISGDINSLNKARQMGMQTLSSPRLRRIYKDALDEYLVEKNIFDTQYANATGLQKRMLKPPTPLKYRRLWPEYTTEMQRLQAQRGTPTLADFRLLEKQTGLDAGVAPISEYQNAIRQLGNMENASIDAIMSGVIKPYKYPNGREVDWSKVAEELELINKAKYNKVFYDPASHVESNWQKVNGIR